MRRRDFLKVVAGSAMTWPLRAHAQQPAMTHVGIVTIQSPTSPPYAAFSQRLRELGYLEGQNLNLDFVNPARQPGGSAGAVQELIRRKVGIVLATYQPTMAASAFSRGVMRRVCG
jgi:putative tryptophan/tyrosine transport system substrate-binding protein